jgi:ribosomal protein S18 acetylase RimI-like enzyme
MARIWVAQPEEAAEVARLLAAFRTWYGKDEPSDEAFLASVRKLIGSEHTEYLLGATDGAPVAVAQVRYRHSVWTSADDCWLEDLYVEDAARGAGLGRAMVEAVLARAQERACRRVELDVDDANTPARALYESLGFAEKNGGAAYMQRHL